MGAKLPVPSVAEELVYRLKRKFPPTTLQVLAEVLEHRIDDNRPLGVGVKGHTDKGRKWLAIDRYLSKQGAPVWLHLLVGQVFLATGEQDLAECRRELLTVAATAVAMIEQIDRDNEQEPTGA